MRQFHLFSNKKKILLTLILLLSGWSVMAQDRTDSLHIEHYNIHLNITDFTNRQIYGYADLTAVAKVNELTSVRLDLKSLTVDSVWVNGVTDSIFYQSGIHLDIPLADTMQQGDTALIRVYYHGRPGTDAQFGGFYFSGEYCYNIGVAFRDLPHNFGRAWYPCLDFFTDKSTYQFEIETEANKMAICGGDLIDTMSVDSNTILWTWRLDQPVPTYLTSVAVGEYEHYSDTIHGLERVIPIDIYTPPSYFNLIPGSFLHLKPIIRTYEAHFGPYPWSRIGYVSVNFNAGAMEHVTNIAYPNFAISGTTTYESLYAHELSHMWFGDLVTCHQAEEMWINEGFARYNEALVAEALNPSDNFQQDGYRNNILKLHRSVLIDAHKDDDGYWAIDSVPQEVTYGSTTYDKGGLVVHTLRKYMGDSIFFASIKNMLNTFAYGNITTEELVSFLSQDSGIDLHDFYEGWIHQPGFLHFSVDSIRPTGVAGEYRFFVRQRLSHARQFANSNKIDLTFFSLDNQNYTVSDFRFDGEYGEGTATLPFEPAFAVVDFYEKMGDAVLDENWLLTGTGQNSSNDLRFKVLVSQITDTVFMRVEDNLVAPDPVRSENTGIAALNPAHYWRIAYTPEEALSEATLRFCFKAGNSNAIDYDFLNGHRMDEIVLAYRRDAADDWHVIPSDHTGTLSTGYLNTQHICPGEYAIALGDSTLGINSSDNNLNHIKIFPNPSGNSITVSIGEFDMTEHYTCQIYDMNGRQVKRANLREANGQINISMLPSSTYILKVFCSNKEIFCTKLIKN
ncbi:MAG: T9SS type A sorting domain-containing protein [Bacteroidales bacterium]|nr:T9SS type A sorting domain-containing protein [Bacteroidales bacterium]